MSSGRLRAALGHWKLSWPSHPAKAPSIPLQLWPTPWGHPTSPLNPHLQP